MAKKMKKNESEIRQKPLGKFFGRGAVVNSGIIW